MRYSKEAVDLPKVSAEAWCVYDVDARKVLVGKLQNHRREIASLTKMMTFLVAYETHQ